MTDRCATFFDCCRRLFRLADYGYDDDGGHDDPPECSILFRKGDRAVLMLVDHVEHYGLPTVQIRPPDPRERFGLHEAIAAVDPVHHRQRPAQGYRMTATQLSAVLEHQAAFLHRHHRALLDDHRAIFAAVERLRGRR